MPLPDPSQGRSGSDALRLAVHGQYEHNDAMQLAGFPRLSIDPAVCGGRPVIKGTRMRVKDVLDLLAARVPEAEILADFPDLEPEDIQASIEYAAAQLDHPVLVVSR